MKNITSLLVASLCLCSVAFAGDFTVIRTLGAHQSKSSSLDVSKGKSSIDVQPTNSDGLVTCSLTNEEGGAILKEKTHRCQFNLELNVPQQFTLKVTNETAVPLDYHAVLHEIK